MIVIPAQHVHMQGDSRGTGEAVQTMREHLGAEVADFLALEVKVRHAPRPVGQVNHRAAQGFVERGVGVTEAGEAGRAAERSCEGGAQGDADVFRRVVVVNCEGNKS
jgi:hypothetical protein